MKNLHVPNQRFYEQYHVDQAKQKCGNLPAFHGARFQQGYVVGSIFKGLFRWAMPHFQQSAKLIGKKALQTGFNVAQDVVHGDNIKTTIRKQAKQAIDNKTSQKSQQAQSGAGKKAIKRKPKAQNSVRLPTRKPKLLRGRRNLKPFLTKNRMAIVHHESRECTKSEFDLFTIPATQTSIHKGQWIEYHPLGNITVLLNLTYLEQEKNI